MSPLFRLALVFLAAVAVWGSADTAMRMQDMPRLFFNGPAQMQCTEGNGCSDPQALPRQALCRNEGLDPADDEVIWSCDFTSVPDTYRVDGFHVACEGWSGPGDLLVRPGSCILQYKYDRVRSPPSPPPTVMTTHEWMREPRSNETTVGDALAFILVMGLIFGGFVGCFMCCFPPTPSPGYVSYDATEDDVPRSTRVSQGSRVTFAEPPMVIQVPAAPPAVDVHHHHTAPSDFSSWWTPPTVTHRTVTTDTKTSSGSAPQKAFGKGTSSY